MKIVADLVHDILFLTFIRGPQNSALSDVNNQDQVPPRQINFNMTS